MNLLESLNRTGVRIEREIWLPRLALLCFWLVFMIYVSVSPYTNDARPTDDMFYIDAAWKLQAGQYTPPTPNQPYHHYLRWPVLLPLSVAIFLFGSGGLVIKLFGMLHLMIASFALLVILQKISKSSLLAFAGAALIVLIPVEILPTRVLSEPVASAWFLTGLAIVVATRAMRSPVPLILSGVCAAIAINAAQVTVFSTPIVWYFAWYFRERTDRPLRDALFAGLWPAVGAIGTYLLIISLEWIAFGDPLIEIKAISLWHLKTVDPADSYWAHILNQQSDNFLFGYTVGLFKKFPTFASLLVMILGVAFWWRSKAFSTVIIGGLIGLALLEVFSILVVDKTYMRFTVIPMVLLMAGGVASYLEAAFDRKGRIAVAATFPLVLISLGLLVQNNLSAMKNDNWTVWFQAPFAAINESVSQEHIETAEVNIVIADPEIVGLIPWFWAANVYTHYAYRDAIRHMQPGETWTPAPVAGKPVSFLVTSDPNLIAAAQQAGYVLVPYTEPSAYPRPSVLKGTTSDNAAQSDPQ